MHNQGQRLLVCGWRGAHACGHGETVQEQSQMPALAHMSSPTILRTYKCQQINFALLVGKCSYLVPITQRTASADLKCAKGDVKD